eukprot:1137662-Pelagomonas_calceolata.AAC.5
MGKLAEILPSVPISVPTGHPTSMLPQCPPQNLTSQHGLTTQEQLKSWSAGRMVQLHLFQPEWVQNRIRATQGTSTSQLFNHWDMKSNLVCSGHAQRRMYSLQVHLAVLGVVRPWGRPALIDNNTWLQILLSTRGEQSTIFTRFTKSHA